MSRKIAIFTAYKNFIEYFIIPGNSQPELNNTNHNNFEIIID